MLLLSKCILANRRADAIGYLLQKIASVVKARVIILTNAFTSLSEALDVYAESARTPTTNIIEQLARRTDRDM